MIAGHPRVRGVRGPGGPKLKVYVVTVEQHYANNYQIAGATPDKEEAIRIAAKHAGSAHIYECEGETIDEVLV